MDSPERCDVLLVHGADDASQIWSPVVSILDTHSIGCVAGDYPWGRLGDPTWSARATAGQLVQADLDRHRPVVCVAHSFGCLALLESLAGHTGAHRPEAIVLVAPFYLSGPEAVTWELVDRTRAEFVDLLRRAVMSRSAASGRTLSAESAELVLGKLTGEMNPLGFISLFTSFVLLRERDLESIAIPAEIIAAADDPALNVPSRREEICRRLKAELTVVAGDDHFLHYNEPTVIVDAVMRNLPATDGPGLVKRG